MVYSITLKSGLVSINGLSSHYAVFQLNPSLLQKATPQTAIKDCLALCGNWTV